MLALMGALSGMHPSSTMAATSWQVRVGAETRDQGIQANAFLPQEIRIDAGDSVRWTFDTGEIHTVSFLSGGPRPTFILPSGGGVTFNPVVAAPAGGSTYSGTGYFNSGLLTEDSPNPTYTLTFTTPGDYAYFCLVHSTMNGKVHVAPAGTPYPQDQAAYDREAQREEARLLADGRRLAAQDRPKGKDHKEQVTAGTGSLQANTSLAVLRFLPDKQVIRAGDTVQWTNQDPETPHTVTFGTEPAGGLLGAFAPSGTDGAGHATISASGQSVNSGFIGAGLPFGAQFSATFTTPGTYSYICALHDDLGMIGTITVLPAPRGRSS
jgi:plastocyanin